MRLMLLGVVMALAGCATATVPEIQATEPIVTMQLRGEPRDAAKCVVSAIEAQERSATVRDFGAEVQVLWTAPRSGTALGLFSLHKLGAGTEMQYRGRPTQDRDAQKQLWTRLLEICR